MHGRIRNFQEPGYGLFTAHNIRRRRETLARNFAKKNAGKRNGETLERRSAQHRDDAGDGETVKGTLTREGSFGEA